MQNFGPEQEAAYSTAPLIGGFGVGWICHVGTVAATEAPTGAIPLAAIRPTTADAKPTSRCPDRFTRRCLLEIGPAIHPPAVKDGRRPVRDTDRRSPRQLDQTRSCGVKHRAVISEHGNIY